MSNELVDERLSKPIPPYITYLQDPADKQQFHGAKVTAWNVAPQYVPIARENVAIADGWQCAVEPSLPIDSKTKEILKGMGATTVKRTLYSEEDMVFVPGLSEFSTLSHVHDHRWSKKFSAAIFSPITIGNGVLRTLLDPESHQEKLIELAGKLSSGHVTDYY